MALVFTNLTTASSTTSSAALTTGLISIPASENIWALICISADNSGAGGAPSLTGVTDQAGNKYEEIDLLNHDPGAAAAGITLGIYLAKISNSLTDQTISATFSPNTTAKAMTVQLITPDVGERPYVIGVGAGVTGSATAISAGAVTVQNGDIIIGATATEDTTAATADSDTTNGTWSTAYTATASTGTVTTSAAITTQRKVVTATGSQTYNTTTAATRDYAVNYIIIRNGPEGEWSMNGVRATP